MPASQRQPEARVADVLEIAMADVQGALIARNDAGDAAVLAMARDCRSESIPAGDDDAALAAGDYEWLEAEELLESSDVLEVEIVRSFIDAQRGLEEGFGDDQLLDDDGLDEIGADEEFGGGELGGGELGDDGEFEDAEFEPETAFVDIDVVETRAQDAAAETLVDAGIVEGEPDTIAPVDPIRVPLWSGANSFIYALTRGLRGMGQSPLVQLLAVGTMAVCMLLLGTTTLILQNAQRVAGDLGLDTPVTVYMDYGVDADALASLQARIAELPEVAEVEHVTPQMALARLQEGLGRGDSISAVGEDERAQLLAGIDPNTLTDSLEIALIAGVEPGFADALASRIDEMEGVDEVAVLGPWVQEVERMLTTLRWLALGVAGLVSLACLAIVWSTIRLGVFARRSEIEILRLVGGTGRFVRGPFVVEGVLQGVLGAGLALTGLWLGFELIRPFLERGMALMFAAGSLRFLSVVEIALALGFGGVLGVIGSRAAVARHA